MGVLFSDDPYVELECLHGADVARGDLAAEMIAQIVKQDQVRTFRHQHQQPLVRRVILRLLRQTSPDLIFHRRIRIGKTGDPSFGILEQIGLSDKAQLPSGELAYAQQRALELGVAIASGAELIMLDEPVAGMSNSEAENAVALIRRITEGKTLIMVEHDMNIVFDIADRISVLVYGEIIATDTPENIRGNKRVQEAYLGEVPCDA